MKQVCTVDKYKNGFKLGFTLAEVLITLGIIGVVAAMTIPTLISATQDNQYKTAYKKAYSVASNAFNSAIAKGDSYVTMTSYLDSVNMAINFAIFQKQFIVSKDCSSGNNSDCWVSGESSNGAPTPASPAFIDNSGMAWSMRCAAGEGFTADYFLVDTNGAKPPNKYGKDRWVLMFYGVRVNGQPVRISIQDDDYPVGSTNSISCPTGPCYYKSWLTE